LNKTCTALSQVAGCLDNPTFPGYNFMDWEPHLTCCWVEGYISHLEDGRVQQVDV
jgi:hypothetical protein